MDLQEPTRAVNRLIELGWTEAGIATRVRSTQPTIHRIKEGGGCFYAIGAALVQLAETESARLAGHPPRAAGHGQQPAPEQA